MPPASNHGVDVEAGWASPVHRPPRERPRVSVVIPAYNRDRFVGLTIESVVAQTFVGWEAVVYDDGSTDRTLEVAGAYAERDSRIKVARGPNQGVAATRNRGLALTDAGA